MESASGQAWLAGCVAATLGLAVWLGLQVVQAEQSHRVAAERVLTDYAGIAAREFANVVTEDLDDFLDELLDHRRRGNWRSETPEGLSRKMDDATGDLGCMCPALNSRTAYFQLDPRNGDGTSHPNAMDRELLGRLGELVVADYDPTLRESYGLISVAGLPGHDAPAVIGYSMAPDSARVHGFVADHAALGEFLTSSFEFERSDIVPLPVADSLPSDSLVFVSVRDPGGPVLFTSSIKYPPTFLARDTLGPQLGSLIVEAAIRPDAADRLVIGGLPRSRLPLLGALLALTIAVGLAALLQIRRQHQLARLRDDFVSGVSHEFRTPLTQIRMFSELLEDDMIETDEQRARAVQIISRESKRLSNLVENVLEFSSLRRNGASAEPAEEIDLRQSVQDVFSAFRPLASAREVSLECDVTAETIVYASRTGVHQILTNLIDNALKYGPEGQTVLVDAHRVPGTTRLRVEDEGVGIPTSERARVWEPYQRLERDLDSDVQGSGLGLAVVAELAERQGGRAWVEDGADGGARFVVELPARRSPAAASNGR